MELYDEEDWESRDRRRRKRGALHQRNRRRRGSRIKGVRRWKRKRRAGVVRG